MRIAKSDDLPTLLAFSRRFHEAKQGKYAFDEASTEAFFRAVMAGGVIFIAPTGFLAGMIVPEPSNGRYRVAHEMFWWSEGRDGLKLKRAFETWAQKNDCDEVQFSHPENETAVGRLLERSGYEPATRVWRKAI